MTVSWKNKIKVTIYTCPECGDGIYSRANHDYNSCHCGKIAVDGGRYDYEELTLTPFRLIGNIDSWKDIQSVIEITVSEKELYDDWNYSTNKFGIIKK